MTLPHPRDPDARIPILARELAGHLGARSYVDLCCDLASGADPANHLDALRYLVGTESPDRLLDRAAYWHRTWGLRGLLHVWSDRATATVVAGLSDDHWRPAEMATKVVRAHEVAGAGDGCAHLAGHGLARVRASALRALAVVGDTEHVAVVAAGLTDPDRGVAAAARRAHDRMRDRLDLAP